MFPYKARAEQPDEEKWTICLHPKEMYVLCPPEPQFLALAAMQLELNECLLNGEYYPYSIIS